MSAKPPDRSYVAASKKLVAEGFTFNARTCAFERGDERVSLRWNGRVYARRRAPPEPRGFTLMPVYTIVVTTADGRQHTTLSDFPDDAAVIADARHVLTAEHTSVAVAKGAGTDAEFLGVWDWCDGEPRWTPQE